MELENLQENKLQILGKVTAGLIHEIRNPLSAITLSLEYLQMIKNDLPEDVRESILACEQATSRIRKLIENLSSFTRKNNSHTSIYSVNEVTMDAISIMNTSAFDRLVNIHIHLDPDLPKILIDKNKLLQVFLNLITNSIEACDHGGEILIRTYKNPVTSELIWEIEDNGCGISDEDRPNILTDFYTSKIKGTGLGLSVCQSILEEFQCSLKFESSKGSGSKFYVLLNSNLAKGEYEI